MQSLLILPLQRETARGEEGVGCVTTYCEAKNSNTLDIRESYGEVLLQEGREMTKSMTTKHSIDFKQIQDILLL